jgi:hypothetical protein
MYALRQSRRVALPILFGVTRRNCVDRAAFAREVPEEVRAFVREVPKEVRNYARVLPAGDGRAEELRLTPPPAARRACRHAIRRTPANRQCAVAPVRGRRA